MHLHRKVIVTILFSLAYFSGFTQEEYPLSRQDSASIFKYDSIANLRLSENQLKECTRFLNLSAMLYWEHNHFHTALEYYEKSLKYNLQLQNENGIAMINNNLAMIYADVKDYPKSLTFFEKTLAARRSQHEKIGIISALINMSVVLNNMHNYQRSITCLKEALDISRELNDPNQMKSCYGMLSETYEKASISDTAMYYFNLYRTFHEMVQKEKVKKTKFELENEILKRQLVETEKEKKELELFNKNIELNKKEEKLEAYSVRTDSLRKNLTKKELALRVITSEAQVKELKIEKERQQMEADKRFDLFIIISLIIFALFLTGIAILLFYRNKEKKETNAKLAIQNATIIQQSEEIRTQTEQLQQTFNKLEEKNKQVTSSIQYAQLIQTAMLTRKDKLQHYLPESFIFFKPRNIVSGDFFWYAKIKDTIIISAIDCTGHGVPGAFMSMIGNNLMNSIVIEKEIIDPAQILIEMDKGVKQSLNQDHTKSQDGMDMAIVTFNQTKNILQIGGAKNSVILSKQQGLEIIKTDRFSIGGKSFSSKRGKIKKFNTTEIQITEPTQFFIFSDGIVDQFGGPKAKKLMISGLQDFILKIKDDSIENQNKKLSDFFDQWKGSTEQIDDVLLISAILKPE